MKITFDIETPKDIETARIALIGLGEAMSGTMSAPEAAPVNEPDAPEATPVDEPDVPAATDPRGGLELDVNGTPWLEGVHATTKGKTADGRWKKRRGVPDEKVNAAEEQARATLRATPDPVLPLAEAPAETPESVAPVTMEELTDVYAAAVEAGKVTPDVVTQLYFKHGCEEIGDIATNETARAGVVAELRAMLEAPAAPIIPGMPGA